MKKIGKYVVRGLLGKGGMSVVYKAQLPVAGRMVALKFLSPHPSLVGLLGREKIRGRFIAEASTIASLRDPHVVELLDFDYHGEEPFFTMEYYFHDLGRLVGEAYRPDLPSRPLSLDKTIHYSRQLLAGLARLSRAGIVHRDIKPGNLMISDEDRIKICDFGFSKVRGERFERPPHLVIGSPFYAAPEQERDPDRADNRADIYSAGVVIHRMLTGFLPDGGIRKPSEHHPNADAAWDALVEKALQPDPRNRFQTADLMLHELEILAHSWEERKDAACRMASAPPPAAAPVEKRTLRTSAVKVRAKDAPDLFGCDALMRPLRYSAADPRRRPGGVVAVCPDDGLAWQTSGARDPIDWYAAGEYVRRLNAEAFAGCSMWRLPTVDELLSILRPPGFGSRDCLSPAFDSRQKALWSCDRCTFTSAWHVDVTLGFAGPANMTSRFYARAVTETGNIPSRL